ncbi:hypothetical protein EVAR_7088_1 [Eumeta japonica]|uniref:Uncharacterized protein n=1 Tax=Eumeta variegata TaxID=151549 RepID=A0A4C1YCQ5_EUMVA|nr:hypothetical protein EVAR_7088_1 [Eumeta japonica]
MSTLGAFGVSAKAIYKGDRLFRSVVDVTTCSPSYQLDRAERCQPLAENEGNLWDASTGSSGKREETGRISYFKLDSEQVLGLHESVILLAETFFCNDWVNPDDPYHTKTNDGDG